MARLSPRWPPAISPYRYARPISVKSARSGARIGLRDYRSVVQYRCYGSAQSAGDEEQAEWRTQWT